MESEAKVMKRIQIIATMFIVLLLVVFGLCVVYAEGVQQEKKENPSTAAPAVQQDVQKPVESPAPPTLPVQKQEGGVSVAATPTASKAIIIYYSKTGHTLDAAKDIAIGMKENNFVAEIKDVKEVKAADLAPYDLILVGSPCHAGSMPFSSGIAGPIEKFLKSIPKDTLKGKIAGAFSVHCSMGGEKTVSSIEKLLQSSGADVAIPGPTVKAGAFMSLYRGPDYSPSDKEKLQKFGKTITKAQEKNAGKN